MSPEIGSSESGSEAERELHILQWEALKSIEPPSELYEFHHNLTAQYSALIEARGGNQKTQAAYYRWLDNILTLDAAVIDILMETGCVMELDLTLFVGGFEARARMDDRRLLTRPLTVEEYVEHCVDIRRTIPMFDSSDGMFTHIIHEWRNLLPPPELEQYHGYAQEAYLYWKENGMDAPLPGSAVLLVNEFNGFSPETQKILRSSGCTNGS